MRRVKKEKRNKVLIFSVIILLLVCAGIAIASLHKVNNILLENSSEATIEIIGNSSTTEPAQELRGTVKDATMNTLTVQGEDNREYYFGTEGVNISTGETGIVIGNPVTVSYHGKLDLNASVQEVELLSITVTDSSLNTENPEPTTGETEPSPPSASVTQKAQEILNAMTLEEKVGQMFIARCPEINSVQKVKEYNLGGYILFSRDFSGKTRDEIIQNIQSYQSAAKIPMFIGVDEEGGTVNRVSTNPNLRAVPFWSPQELYAEGGFDLIQSDTQEKCELLNSLGINLNFAPICDVSQNPEDFIYDRSFGQNAEQTAAYVHLVVQTMFQEGMGSVLKHFPGYGNNVVSCMDSQTPASLSSQVHKILREELKFTGVIITDDLAMDGVRNFAEDTKIAVQAVKAGNDMLCCTDFEVQIPAILEAVKQGEITEERIDESVLRILELKISLGII